MRFLFRCCVAAEDDGVGFRFLSGHILVHYQPKCFWRSLVIGCHIKEHARNAPSRVKADLSGSLVDAADKKWASQILQPFSDVRATVGDLLRVVALDLHKISTAHVQSLSISTGRRTYEINSVVVRDLYCTDWTERGECEAGKGFRAKAFPRVGGHCPA